MIEDNTELLKLAQKRVKRGECPTCGVKLFRIGGFLGKKKEPINVPNVSEDGNCLACDEKMPLSKQRPRPAAAAAAPHNPSERIPGVPAGGPPSGIQPPSILDCADDATMVSAITMDIRLHDGHNDHRDGEINLNFGNLPSDTPAALGLTRKEPPTPLHKQQLTTSVGKSSRLLPLNEDFDMDALLANRGKKASGTSDSRPPQLLSSDATGSYARDSFNASKRNLAASNPSTPPESAPTSMIEKNPSSSARKMPQKEIVLTDNGQAQKEIVFNNGDNDPDDLTVSSMNEDDPPFIEKPSHDQVQIPVPVVVEEEDEEAFIPQSLLRDVTLPISRPRESNVTVEQIAELLESLRTGSNQVNKLEDIASAIWKFPGPAKEVFFSSKGTEMLVEIMWKDIGDSVLQDAAMNVLLTVALSGENASPKEILSIENGASVVDALLVCMQMNSMVDSIQRTGCRLLCCLAAASGEDNEINDGTLQGALHLAINALEVNSRSPDLKQWATKTLYYQCANSSNSDANKRALVDFSSQTGKSGVDILVDVLRASETTEEWGSLLFWNLSADSAVARKMSPARNVLAQMLGILERACTRTVKAQTIQACLATLSNLLKIRANQDEFNSSACIMAVLEIFRKYGMGKDAVFLSEIGSLIATIAPLAYDAQAVASSGRVSDLLYVAASHQDDSQLVAFYLEALLALSFESEEITVSLSSDQNINSIISLCRAESNESYSATLLCLLTNIITISALRPSVTGRILDACSHILEKHSDDVHIVTGAFGVIRNVCTVSEKEHLNIPLIEKSIVRSMKHHSKSKVIQTHGCFIFLNLGQESELAIPTLLDVLRNQLDTPDLLMFTSFLLWQLLENNEEKKSEFLSENGLEVLTSIIVMHQADTELIEMIAGTLASLSALPKSLGSIDDKQVMSDLVEIMKRNGDSPDLLRYAILFLKNTIVNNPLRLDDVEVSIPLIVAAMGKHTKDTSLLREACAFLWACAIYSEECRGKIMGLNGLELTLQTLEFCEDPSLEDTALALFNALSIGSQGAR